MEDQVQEVAAQPRKMIHLQVAGEFTQEDLSNLVQQFHQAHLENGVVATPNNVTASIIETPEQLDGAILTPKMTAKELASVVVAALQGFDVGQGNKPSANFADLDAELQAAILQRVQFVLRFGWLPPVFDNSEEQNKTRDAIFEATVRALGGKLAQPDASKTIQVVRHAQKEGDEDAACGFLELAHGDIFSYGDNKFVAESDPYINWIADPLPLITIDAKLYEEPAPVPADEVKASAPAKKQVQSRTSKSKAHHRKK